MNEGWIGDIGLIGHFLAVVGADKDEEGNFKVYGDDAVVVGLGGKEAVVRGTAEYSIDGHRCNLAAGLRSTSYGVPVKAF